MRKWVIAGLVAAMLCSLFTVTASAASRLPSFVGVVMDGQKIWFPDAQAFVDENNRTLVPVRFIAEQMGAKVGWEPKTMTVPIERDDLHIVLTIGDSTALVNGKEVVFDSKAITSGGRTFVPLRFVSEALGAEVNWDSPTSTVFISTQEDANAKYDEWGRLIRTTNLPKNAQDYPYILADVPNEAYEMAYPYSHPTDSKVSSVLYSTIPEFNKKNVDIWMSRLKTFGALWLNVDYKTIDDTWAQAVFATKVQSSNAELKYIRRYAEWVKENKIQIEGYLDPEPSMIYRNGFGDNYVRAKFRIKFVSFKENKDLIYDERFPNQQTFEKGVWYEGYTDISMSTNVGGNWGPTLKVSPSASLFYNHTMKRME
ncbi:copper amine oxidase N-terminal domain-containing protein [Paenibacillus macerans]|uniref:copper amine oxidase N-terminal domain-containing protein n=1 Tax=Paenibacillus macerans TaxID=44252 RepID=UPI002DC06074|nr:copper amine oxidase N-terminal domain-containing protein [Paenibacillus macerans]MEC0136983.1 copper amine oxidase N-terminal domain-containing protein [Paenibacillus macerans]